MNQYITFNEPWKLIKSSKSQDKERANVVLYHCIESLRICGILLQPVLPDSMDKLLTKLGVIDRSFERALFELDRKDCFARGNVVLFPKLKKIDE